MLPAKQSCNIAKRLVRNIHTKVVEWKQKYGIYGAFCLDIDGVLMKRGQVLPEAKRDMKRLYEKEECTPRVPLAFLTNSGGMTEEMKAEDLTKKLGAEVEKSQVVLSHTPFRGLVEKFKGVPTVKAVFVFTDPSDWYLELQLILVLIQGNCIVGADPNIVRDGIVLYFSHDDFVWSNDHPLPRIGLGAFRNCIIETCKRLLSRKECANEDIWKASVEGSVFSRRKFSCFSGHQHVSSSMS